MKYIELVKGLFTDVHVARAKQLDPYVAYSIEDDRLMFNLPHEPQEPVVYGSYVTFTAEEDGSSVGLTKLSTYQTLEYSTDTSTWDSFDTTTNISLNNGDKVYVRGILIANNTYSKYTQFKMTGKIAASGNCNAIWNYQDLNAPLKDHCGHFMFMGCNALTQAPELPATASTIYCYADMFYDCTSLTHAPELPATTLASNCYNNMFRGCTNLTQAPEVLPATTLAENCYTCMFMDCTALTKTPELPATTLAIRCYYSIFQGCTSLTQVPEVLPATTLTDYCYANMFQDCASLTTAPELPATTLAKSCYAGMFNGCTLLAISPELPAITLADNCYDTMFQYCTSLTTAPELPAASLTGIGRCYFYMFFGCTNLNYIKCLATDISATDCTINWVYGVASTGTFIKHPDMNSWTTGSNGIPSGWTVEDTVL